MFTNCHFFSSIATVTTSFSGTSLTTFMDAKEIEIRNIIKLPHAKSCELDPLPTSEGMHC